MSKIYRVGSIANDAGQPAWLDPVRHQNFASAEYGARSATTQDHKARGIWETDANGDTSVLAAEVRTDAYDRVWTDLTSQSAMLF